MVHIDVREFGQHPSDNWTLSAYTHIDSERGDEMHTQFNLKEVELVQDVLSKARVAFGGWLSKIDILIVGKSDRMADGWTLSSRS
jgi:hypothetical protein